MTRAILATIALALAGWLAASLMQLYSAASVPLHAVAQRR